MPQMLSQVCRDIQLCTWHAFIKKLHQKISTASFEHHNCQICQQCGYLGYDFDRNVGEVIAKLLYNLAFKVPWASRW